MRTVLLVPALLLLGATGCGSAAAPAPAEPETQPAAQQATADASPAPGAGAGFAASNSGIVGPSGTSKNDSQGLGPGRDVCAANADCGGAGAICRKNHCSNGPNGECASDAECPGGSCASRKCKF